MLSIVLRRNACSSWSAAYSKLNLCKFSNAPRVGFEVSGAGTAEFDNYSLQERSLRHGCKLIMTSSGEGSVSSLELLLDLSASEDLDLKELIFGHRLLETQPSLSSSASFIPWLEDIDRIKSVLSKRDIDFVVAPYNTFVKEDAMSSNDNSSAVDVHNRILARIVSAKEAINNLCGKHTRFGLDISSSFLSTANEQQIHLLMSLLSKDAHNFNDGLGAQQTELLSTSVDSENSDKSKTGSSIISLLTVATNCCTYDNAAKVLHWSRALGIETIATEVLRMHPRRPGLITPPPHPRTGKKIDAAFSDADKSSNSVPQIMTMKDFEKALDGCILMEKQLVEKGIAVEGVEKSNLMWGYTLAKAQAQIRSLEEWQFLYSKQVEPALQAGLESLKAESKDGADWVLLYSPMVKFLFSSFEAVLQARKMQLCDAVAAALTSEEDNAAPTTAAAESAKQSGSIELAEVPKQLGTLALALGADSVLLTGTEVRLAEWDLAAMELQVGNTHYQAAMNRWAAVRQASQPYAE